MPASSRRSATVLALCALLLASSGTQVRADERGVRAAVTALASPAYVADVDAAQQRTTRAARRIMSMLDEARRMHDARRARCLDIALGEMNAQARILAERARRMDAALARGDEPEARHQAALAAYVARHLDDVEHRAVACSGIVRLRNGTRVIVEIDHEPLPGEAIDAPPMPPVMPPAR